MVSLEAFIVIGGCSVLLSCLRVKFIICMCLFICDCRIFYLIKKRKPVLILYISHVIDIDNKFIVNKLHLSMNREPLLRVLAIAETCRSGSLFMNKYILLVMNLFMKNLLLLSVLSFLIRQTQQQDFFLT